MKCDLCLYEGEGVKPYIYETKPETLTTNLCNHHASYWGYLKEGE